ncbi:MAG: hypothetical protein AB7T06_29250 [Kofleriaceae bacterium]
MLLARRDEGPKSLAVVGEEAEIRVEGVLTEKEDFWLWLFGVDNTTYADILDAITAVRADPSIRRVNVCVDSPGGAADGLFETMDAFEVLRREKDVRVTAKHAHSAAYGIAAAAGPITARSDAAMFGSVGVAVSFWLSDHVLDLTNTESPDKRPDLKTDEGRAVVRRELDAIFGLFADRIARGRSTTSEDVAQTFGRGASFVAGEAKRRGMIDAVALPNTQPIPARAAASTTTPQKASKAGKNVHMTTSLETQDENEDERDEEEASETPPEDEPTPVETADDEEHEEPDDDDAPGDEGPGDGDEDDEEPDAADEDEDEEDEEEMPAATARARRLLGRPDATVTDALDELEDLQVQGWLDAECTKRKLVLKPDQRARYVRLVRKGERKLVRGLLDDANRPPQGSVLEQHNIGGVTAGEQTAIPANLVAATNMLLDAARGELVAAKAKDLSNHVVVAHAERLARKRWPHLAK